MTLPFLLRLARSCANFSVVSGLRTNDDASARERRWLARGVLPQWRALDGIIGEGKYDPWRVARPAEPAKKPKRPLDYSVTSNHRCGRAFLASVERQRRSAGSHGCNAHAVTGTAANMAVRQKPAHASPPRRSHNRHRRELKVHRMTASHVQVTEARGLSPTSASSLRSGW
jgi:hypothetical protein